MRIARLWPALALAFVAVFAVANAQVTPSPAPTPQTQTNYQTFHVTLGVPTTGPVIETQTAGQHVCAVVLNYPFSSAFITPQGSNDYFTWNAISTIGKGSITLPGLYIGPNAYKYFRPYFTQFNDPGAIGWEGCADDESALIAPMLNGQNGVLNNYQQITAIGHAGCATFDASGNLLPTGSACGGGGGSSCGASPSPFPSPPPGAPYACVVLQPAASPTPQSYNNSTGSAAVVGTLQGGNVYSYDGTYNSVATNGNPDFSWIMEFCPGRATSGTFVSFCDAQPSWIPFGFEPAWASNASPPPSSIPEGDNVFQVGRNMTFEEEDNVSFIAMSVGNSHFNPSNGGGITLDATNSTSGATNFAPTLSLDSTGISGDYIGHANLYGPTMHMGDTQYRVSGVSLTNSMAIGVYDELVSIGCCDALTNAPVQYTRTIDIGQDTPVTGGGTNATAINFSGRFNSTDAPWHTCTMASSTTCSYTGTVAFQYTTPICIATVQGSTPIGGACSVSAGVVTVTATTSNSDTWAFIVLGNPN